MSEVTSAMRGAWRAMGGNVLLDKWYLRRNVKEAREQAIQISQGQAFQGETTASAKALRQEHALHGQGSLCSRSSLDGVERGR